jgi:hypothetical protein
LHRHFLFHQQFSLCYYTSYCNFIKKSKFRTNTFGSPIFPTTLCATITCILAIIWDVMGCMHIIIGLSRLFINMLHFAAGIKSHLVVFVWYSSAEDRGAYIALENSP